MAELADDLALVYAKHEAFFDEFNGDLRFGDIDEVQLKHARLWLKNAIMCARAAARGPEAAARGEDGRPECL
ncbi:hypothetical protein Srot_2121 [Segniliparus rotundus DSM 44985]|uniref:Uncharacterized protein n=1 Tax=Segniliparus rotundus (strain ATCC BAA-972 / CDC 1076 / CIP 108378 / DSM 44985 / JCM 13578) TaxID=640132 RepID=D6Z9E4_SEGRD|nr:hypothetical protein [Segniliparus rotundus]ADG98574.1 hypothetical protein Srot_2121 [Segniliparus rotundus DSM 44985]